MAEPIAAPTATPELVWRWPLNAQKAHVFEKSDSLSLCRRWLYTGRDQPFGELGEKPGREDCAACWREAKKRVAPTTVGGTDDA